MLSWRRLNDTNALKAFLKSSWFIWVFDVRTWIGKQATIDRSALLIVSKRQATIDGGELTEDWRLIGDRRWIEDAGMIGKQEAIDRNTLLIDSKCKLAIDGLTDRKGNETLWVIGGVGEGWVRLVG